MPYRIAEVDAQDAEIATTIHRFNSLDEKTFPLLKPHHLECGYWWLAYPNAADGVICTPDQTPPVAFAGLVPNTPFDGYGYLKRAYVLPDHRGQGLQCRLLFTRELKARELGWTHLVSECAESNLHSSANFRRAGFERCEPEQRWGVADSVYWIKKL